MINVIYKRTCRISNDTSPSLFLPFYHHEICNVLPLKSLRLVNHYRVLKIEMALLNYYNPRYHGARQSFGNWRNLL